MVLILLRFKNNCTEEKAAICSVWLLTVLHFINKCIICSVITAISMRRVRLTVQGEQLGGEDISQFKFNILRIHSLVGIINILGVSTNISPKHTKLL